MVYVALDPLGDVVSTTSWPPYLHVDRDADEKVVGIQFDHPGAEEAVFAALGKLLFKASYR